MKRALVQTRRQATSWLESLQDARLHVRRAPTGNGQCRHCFSLPGAATTCSGGLALLPKHRRRTCKRAFVLKRALVQTRRQLPGLNHRRIRACMCVFGVWLSRAGRDGQFWRCFSMPGAAATCSGGPALLPKHPRHTCKRAFLLKRALVQTRRQLPGLNHCRMHVCLRCLASEAAPDGQLRRCFSLPGVATTGSGAPPCWPNTIDTHASAHCSSNAHLFRQGGNFLA